MYNIYIYIYREREREIPTRRPDAFSLSSAPPCFFQIPFTTPVHPSFSLSFLFLVELMRRASLPAVTEAAAQHPDKSDPETHMLEPQHLAPAAGLHPQLDT